MNAPRMPDGMVEVSRDAFYAALYADKRDIMPKNRQRDFTTWETPEGWVWGWQTPGWANPGDRRVYAIRAAVAQATGSAS
jgi:hypothetical protein